MSNDKSPLHPSALRIRDLHPGRRVIVFNRTNGIRFRATITSAPRIVDAKFLGRSLCIKLRKDSGEALEETLRDLGVIPYSKEWNLTNFIVDARKEHLLPPAVASFRPYGD